MGELAGQGSYYPIKRPDGSINVINVDGQRVPQQGYITDEITEYALTLATRAARCDKALFLYLSHKAVHSDAVPAPRHRGQYDDVTFELPSSVEITDAYLEGKPMWVKNQRNSWHGIDFAYASDREMTDYLKDYFGALSSVDDSIGTLRAYLAEAGIAEDTVIIFYSDNGFLTGDHGLIDKRNAYEGSIRVPMIVAAPGRVPAGAVNDTRIRNLDLAPTFLGAASCKHQRTSRARTPLPLMTGSQDREQWGEPDFVYQYYWEWSFPMTPTTLAIVRDGLKYIQYHGVWDIEELYDLNADPLELTNLINHPDYYHQRQALRKALYARPQGPSGQNAIPHTPRLAEGMNLRDKDGPKVAPFPPAGLSNPTDRTSSTV